VPAHLHDRRMQALVEFQISWQCRQPRKARSIPRASRASAGLTRSSHVPPHVGPPRPRLRSAPPSTSIASLVSMRRTNVPRFRSRTTRPSCSSLASTDLITLRFVLKKRQRSPRPDVRWANSSLARSRRAAERLGRLRSALAHGTALGRMIEGSLHRLSLPSATAASDTVPYRAGIVFDHNRQARGL